MRFLLATSCHISFVLLNTDQSTAKIDKILNKKGSLQKVIPSITRIAIFTQ